MRIASGRRLATNYVIETETQYAYKSPKLRSITYMKHIEQNRLGRYAYSPKQVAPRGTSNRYTLLFFKKKIIIRFCLVPTYNEKP